MEKINLKKLKYLRNCNGYTIEYMANLLNICNAHYCQIENGNRNLSYKRAVEIADIFNLKPDNIFYVEKNL